MKNQFMMKQSLGRGDKWKYLTSKWEKPVLFMLLVFGFVLSGRNCRANYIRIDGVVTVAASASPDTLLLKFPLKWENSWRDDFNWDAAWIFFKYKVGSGDWQHVNLGESGHTFSGTDPYAFMTGKTGSNVVGLFVFRAGQGAGSVVLNCEVKCHKSALGNLTPEQFQSNDAFILAQGIEMVYVPYGAYALGDGQCLERFAASDGSPAIVDCEDALNNTTPTRVHVVNSGTVGSSGITLSANYPKGYRGFYIMKYELSQEQYVAFLNTLKKTEQVARVPQCNDQAMAGKYIFGDPNQPTARNGIVLNVPGTVSTTAIFANNLNNDGKYAQADDGKTIACNYLSPEDMIAYCCWAGLRPMSEMEYEKASRPLYPSAPAAGGFAWNGSGVPVSLASVSNTGKNNERPNAGNTNFGGNLQGPVRCGAFATSSTSAEGAGATFWGVMEMSGNLKELCYGVDAGNAFDGTVLGDGTYVINKWNAVPANIGVRGGAFSSAQDRLHTSDRDEMSYYTGRAMTDRDSTVTFRGVRPVTEPVIAGSVVVKDEEGNTTNWGCLGVTTRVQNDVAPSVNLPGMTFSYMWYVSEANGPWTLIPGATGQELNYSSFVNTTASNRVYKFKRKAICQVGEATSAELTLNVPNTSLGVFPANVYLDGANASSSLMTAKVAAQAGGAFSWLYNGVAIDDSPNGNVNITSNTTQSIYRASRDHFGDFTVVNGVMPVICRYTIGGCSMDSVVKVHVSPFRADPCGGLTNVVDADGKSYNVVKIGNQCWMQQSINVGDYTPISSGRAWQYDVPGIQKWCSGCSSNNCYTSDEANCNKYGGLYEWWEVVCAGHCSHITNPDMNIEQGNYETMEQAVKAIEPDVVMAGDGRRIRGLCPEGWHLPTDEEWKQLEMHLGMSRADAELAYPNGNADAGWGRQTTGPGIIAQGTRMKSVEDNWNGQSVVSSADDRDIFYGRPHGNRGDGALGFYYLGSEAIWWSSTAGGTGSWDRGIYISYTSVSRYPDVRSYGFSVRCVRD